MTTEVTFRVWNEGQQRYTQGQRTFLTRDDAVSFVGRVTHPESGKIKQEDIISVDDLP